MRVQIKMLFNNKRTMCKETNEKVTTYIKEKIVH